MVFELVREIQAGDFQKIEEKYADWDISAEVLRVIGVILDSKKLIKQAENGQEVYNMCKSLEILEEQSRQIGISQGLTKGLINCISLLLKSGQDIGIAVANCAVEFDMSEKEVWNVWNSR